MARNTQFLDQAACTVVSDGTIDEDHMSGDSIRVIPNGEGSALEAGFDSTVTSFSTDQSGTFEQDFKLTSPSLDKYQQLWQLQKQGAARLFNCMVYTGARQAIRLEGCSVMNPGQTGTGGKTMSANTVVLNVQKIIYG